MTAKEFRAIRDRKKYSNGQMAAALRVSLGAVKSWAAGRAVPEVPRAGQTISMADAIRALPRNPQPRRKAGNPNWTERGNSGTS